MPTPVELPAVPVEQEAVVSLNLPARIVAETIELDAPVVEMDWQIKEAWGQLVSEWNIPINEAGWHRNSARPGAGNNVVISGHNNSLGGHVFARLEELEVGDQITLWSEAGTAFAYQVDQKKLIRAWAPSAEAAADLQQVMASTPAEQLTLITCWPSWSNTHRLIIIAKPL
jgi:sortase A